MSFESSLSLNLIKIDSVATTRTAVLTEISRLFLTRLPHLNESDVFDLFWQREQLGSTSVGHGVALPHVRCPHIPTPFLACLRLLQPIDFGGLDRQPCDLFFALMVPAYETSEHLNLLGSLCGALQRQTIRQSCRSASSVANFAAALRFKEPLNI